jgi:urea carboxylase-associated protein 2
MQLDEQSPDAHRERYFALKAKARAKAQAAPPSLDAPDPVATAILRRETVPGGWYWTGHLRRGETLRIVNTDGSASVSLLLWNARDTSERYNAGDTVKLQWTARLTKGRVLFSDMGRVLASITGDSHGRHDAVAGGSTPASNQRRYGDATLRNTRDNFRLAAAKHGMGRPDVPPCLTLFADVTTDETGGLAWQERAPAPGDFVDLRIEMDVIAAISNCPHPLNPETTFAPPPIDLLVLPSPRIGADDLCRNFGEEAARGFDNTDAYLSAMGEV